MTTIRFQIVDRKGAILTREKTFKTEEEMQKWVERREKAEAGGFIGVIAYSYS